MRKDEGKFKDCATDARHCLYSLLRDRLRMDLVIGLCVLRRTPIVRLEFPRLPGAAAGALQDAEVCAVGADDLAILVGHDARNLVQMSQVVGGPSREQFRQSYWAEGRMTSTAGEILRAQIQSAKFDQVLGAYASEFVQ